jgi:hypothetical protein
MMSSAGSIEIEGTTEEDAAYRGSTFREVVDAVFANPYQGVWGAAGEPPLPLHEVTLGSVLHGLLHSGRFALLKAAERTVDSRADLRWGPDRTGFRRPVADHRAVRTLGVLRRWEDGAGRGPILDLLH